MFRTVRDLALGLRPSMLDDFGLQAALEWHVRDFTRRYTIDVELKTDGDVAALSDKHRTCVYRIVQEAMTNCVRHAQADDPRRRQRRDGQLRVPVVDDGVGLDPSLPRHGLGLRGIDERVRELRGTMTISRQPDSERRSRSSCRCRRRRCLLRVLLADDHSIVRRGLRGLLEAAGLPVVGEASDGLEAVRLCEELRPDIVILDIGMPKLSGIEVAARAQKLDRAPGVIILSVHGDESYIMRALAAGARAYLLKSATDEDLIPAVRAVAAGKPFFSPAVTAVLVEDYVRRLQQRGLTDSYHLLTDREKEVLQLLAEGRSNKEVATLLDLGLSTVETHRRQPDAEAQSPQHRGDRPLCRPEGPDCLKGVCPQSGRLRSIPEM